MIHKQLEDSVSLLAWNAGVCWVITPSSCLWPLTLGGVASPASREAHRVLHPHVAPGQGAVLCWVRGQLLVSDRSPVFSGPSDEGSLIETCFSCMAESSYRMTYFLSSPWNSQPHEEGGSFYFFLLSNLTSAQQSVAAHFIVAGRRRDGAREALPGAVENVWVPERWWGEASRPAARLCLAVLGSETIQ